MNFVRAVVLNPNKSIKLVKRTKALFGNAPSDANKIALPAAYNEESTFHVNLNGNGMLYVHVHAVLGAVTDFALLVSFQDPQYDTVWLPSKDAVARNASLATHEWHVTADGDYILNTRQEHRHFKKARVQFRYAGGAPDAATAVLATWFHDGHMPLVPEQ